VFVVLHMTCWNELWLSNSRRKIICA